MLHFYYYAEGYYADCRYAEYHYAGCHVCLASFTLNVVMPSVVDAECYDFFIMLYGIYAECHIFIVMLGTLYAECRYLKCRGTAWDR